MKKLLLLTIVVLTTLSTWSQNRFTRGADKEYNVRLVTGNELNATYSWSVLPENGTSTDLDALNGNSATIVWDGPIGLYTLSVQVIDGNGCISETINQEVEILAPGDLVFASTLPSTIICSDLAGGVEGSNLEHSQSIFQVTYAGESNLLSAKITIQNPNGEYVDANGQVLADQQSPQISIQNSDEDKTIDVNISDSWENTTDSNVQFEITLISVTTADQAEIVADTANDIKRTITVQPKPVIGFQ